MFAFARAILRSSAVWLIGGYFVAWGGWHIAKPTRPMPTPQQQEMLEDLALQANAWAGALDSPRRTTAFLTFDRDPFGFVSDGLRDACDRADTFDLSDFSFVDKLCRKTEWTCPMVASRSVAAEIALDRGCRQAIWGRVNEFSDIAGRSRVDVLLELVDARTSRLIASENFVVDERAFASIAAPLTMRPASGEAWSFASRAVAWAIGACLLPLITFPIARRIVTADSNAAIIALLVTYALAGAAMTWGLFLRDSATLTIAIALPAAVILATLYNLHALTTIKHISE